MFQQNNWALWHNYYNPHFINYVCGFDFKNSVYRLVTCMYIIVIKLLHSTCQQRWNMICWCLSSSFLYFWFIYTLSLYDTLITLNSIHIHWLSVLYLPFHHVVISVLILFVHLYSIISTHHTTAKLFPVQGQWHQILMP